MKQLWQSVNYWLIARWRQVTRYDLKGDLQMDERAAWQDVRDAVLAILGAKR